MNLLGLSGSPMTQSKTLLAVEKAVEYAQRDPEVSVSVINIRDYNVDFCRGRDDKDAYGTDTRFILDAICNADALIVGTPIYRGSYTGILKNIFDMLPNDALRGKPVGLIGTGGTDHHFLAVEHELKPLFGFFDALIVPGYAYAKNDDYSEDGIQSERVLENLRQVAEAVVKLGRLVPREIVGASPPEIPRRALGV